jgi:hypothetical protein
MAQQESMFPFPASAALPEPRQPRQEEEGQLFNSKQAESPQHQHSYPNPMSPLSPVDSVVRASSASPARKTRKFTCVRLLGKGGFAEVYLARDNETLMFVLFPSSLIFFSLRFRTNFAMKACQPIHQDILDNEIFVLRRMQSHRNIVKYINAYGSFIRLIH